MTTVDTASHGPGGAPTSALDPFSAEFRLDPFTAYRELRDLGPVVWLPQYRIWAVARYEQVREVLTDWRRFSNAGGGGLRNYFIDKPWRPPSQILEVDPPEHTRTRKIFMDVVTPARLASLREAFEAEAERVVDAALEKGDVDGVTDVIRPFPMTVFPDAVGMKKGEDRMNMLVYGSMVFGAFGPITPWYEELMKQADSVTAWILERCKREALAPGGIGAAVYEHADAAGIEPERAILLVRSLLSAGVDTTVDSMGLCLKCLAEHPDQWALLRDNPDLARSAFEEATRYDSSSQSLFRTTLDDTQLEGLSLGKHAKVMTFIGSAGRDERKWDQPERFDITRRVAAAQLGYGTGIHGCVAQNMARLEAEVFFRALARKVQTIEVTGKPELRLNPGLRGLASLPLRLTRKPH